MDTGRGGQPGDPAGLCRPDADSDLDAMMEPEIPTSCDGCGACCLTQESPPMYIAILMGVYDIPDNDPDAKRVAALPEPLKDELNAYIFRLASRKGHPNRRVCLWFDEQTRRCKHYDLRPEICREEVQVGDDACLQWRQKLYEAQ